MRTTLARVLATAGGLGDRLPAPGTTAGSVLGVALFAALVLGGGYSPRLVAVLGSVLLIPLAVWACGIEALRRGLADPGPVVLDEVAGQWLALAVVALAHPEAVQLPHVAASFFLFRVFDIWKPGPIRVLERLPGGWGIVADDLGAGLAAACVHLLGLSLWR